MIKRSEKKYFIFKLHYKKSFVASIQAYLNIANSETDQFYYSGLNYKDTIYIYIEIFN